VSNPRPLDIGVAEAVDGYEFSSYNDYIETKDKTIIDTSFALSILTLKEFIEFHNEMNDDKCLDITEVRRINDEKAKGIIYKVSKCKNPSEFQALNLYKRDKYIRRLKEKGLSIRQIERLTGINRGIVLKA